MQESNQTEERDPAQMEVQVANAVRNPGAGEVLTSFDFVVKIISFIALSGNTVGKINNLLNSFKFSVKIRKEDLLPLLMSWYRESYRESFVLGMPRTNVYPPRSVPETFPQHQEFCCVTAVGPFHYITCFKNYRYQESVLQVIRGNDGLVQNVFRRPEEAYWSVVAYPLNSPGEVHHVAFLDRMVWMVPLSGGNPIRMGAVVIAFDAEFLAFPGANLIITNMIKQDDSRPFLMIDCSGPPATWQIVTELNEFLSMALSVIRTETSLIVLRKSVPVQWIGFMRLVPRQGALTPENWERIPFPMDPSNSFERCGRIFDVSNGGQEHLLLELTQWATDHESCRRYVGWNLESSEISLEFRMKKIGSLVNIPCNDTVIVRESGLPSFLVLRKSQESPTSPIYLELCQRLETCPVFVQDVNGHPGIQEVTGVVRNTDTNGRRIPGKSACCIYFHSAQSVFCVGDRPEV